MKTCTCCKKEFSLSCFSKDRQKSDGLNSYSKECMSLKAKLRRETYGNTLRQQSRESRLRNIDDIRRKDNERSKDPKRKASKNARQRYYLVKHRSLGKLFQSDTEAIYHDCCWLNANSVEQFEVDHIVPLQGANVSGLHVPWNLEIISRFKNRSKGNKY